MKKVVFKTVVEIAVKKYFQIAIQASGRSKRRNFSSYSKLNKHESSPINVKCFQMNDNN